MKNIYKKVLDNLYYGVLVIDKDGILIYANEKIHEYYSLEIEKILNCNINVLEMVFKKENKIIPIVMREKKEISLFQETNSGKKIFVTAKPVLDEHNEIEMIIINCYEILFHNKVLNKNMEKKDSLIIESDEEGIAKNYIVNNLKELSKVAQFDVTILLLGESGTGKSTEAKLIHNFSKRKDKQFFTINCTTIPGSLIESELFGYEKGSFTGALKEGKKGLVEMASGGTLFLDEIGELPIEAQSKLLELIENKTYMPIGGNKKRKTDIRIITATNKNLKKLVDEGKFREDLYYRLNVIELVIAPLRDRKEEIPEFVNFFVEKINKKYNLKKIITEEAIKEFLNYSWPGNIRELEHFIEKIIIETDSNIIGIKNIKNKLKYFEPNYNEEEEFKLPTLKEYLEESERKLIIEAYKKYNSSYKVADALNISQSQASRKIRKYIIQ
ncbi:MAG: sigma-54 interaction domain-containing protein [Sarcina sp.]